MMRSVFREGETLRQDLTEAEIASIIQAGAGLLWVDLTSSADREISAAANHTEKPGEAVQHVLGDVFHFHPLAIEDCLNTRIESPKVDDYGDYLFIVAQSAVYGGRSERLDLTEVDLFLGPNYVVTSRQMPVPPIDELFDRACENLHLVNRGADFLAHTVIDSLVDQLLPAVEVMDEHIDELEQTILTRPERRLLSEVLLLKRNTLRLRRSILPQRDMVNRLSRGEFGALIRPEALIFYRDVYDHIVRVEEMLEGLRDLADGALGSYLSVTNNRLSEVMKAMSVVAVIFLPLTLIASIFGTNLDYSPFGLTFKAGFYLMLAFMALIALALVVYFHKRGWF
jgi:magnesium transporter